MKAYRLLAWQEPPVLVEVPVPEPGPGQVLVRIAGAGACHSDLHLMEWPEGRVPFRVPFTLGHENAGWVERLGAGAAGFEPGDPVAVYGPWGCGACASCLRGMENVCEHWRRRPFRGGGLGADGGMAEFLLVPATRYLVPLRDLDPVQAAPLTDAGLTPYHAVRGSAHVLRPGGTAVVIGAGGLGQMAVQVLAGAAGVRVVAIDVSAERLRTATELGAEETVLSGPEARAQVRELTGGRGADAVFDFVGATSTLELAAGVARPLGRVVLVGAGEGTIPFGFAAVAQECEFVVSSWGTLPELAEVVDLAERGLLRAPVTTFPLSRADEAYAALRRGELAGRAVVVPDGG